MVYAAERERQRICKLISLGPGLCSRLRRSSIRRCGSVSAYFHRTPSWCGSSAILQISERENGTPSARIALRKTPVRRVTAQDRSKARRQTAAVRRGPSRALIGSTLRSRSSAAPSRFCDDKRRAACRGAIAGGCCGSRRRSPGRRSSRSSGRRPQPELLAHVGSPWRSSRLVARGFLLKS
jgi:hypothetical protein